MATIILTLEYWNDGGWYVGQLVECPGVISQGKTLDALQANLLDAYRLLKQQGRGAHPSTPDTPPHSARTRPLDA
jgi:predicted RNase H-like HicB family nuclease